MLLIKRGKDPLRGRWTVPGGTVEWGETLEEALVREIREETGLTVRPREILTVFELIERETGEATYHFVIVDYLCDYVTGTLRAGSDAEAAVFVEPEELPAYELPEKTREVVGEGLRRSGTRPGGSPATDLRTARG